MISLLHICSQPFYTLMLKCLGTYPAKPDASYDHVLAAASQTFALDSHCLTHPYTCEHTNHCPQQTTHAMLVSRVEGISLCLCTTS